MIEMTPKVIGIYERGEGGTRSRAVWVGDEELVTKRGRGGTHRWGESPLSLAVHRKEGYRSLLAVYVETMAKVLDIYR